MKRNFDSAHSIDGTTLKKIKKLAFRDDEKCDSFIEKTENVRESIVNKVDLSDDESDSDSEEDSIESSNLNDEAELNDEEKQLLARYKSSSIAKSIADGMEDARKEVASNMDFDDFDDFDLDQVENFDKTLSDTRSILSTYKQSKKFPTMVKVLPQNSMWENIMDNLDFPSWSPPAVHLMAKQFRAKGGDPAILFYHRYLLPYVRENIARNRRLEDILFRTLKDALYRRKEFMKGFLFPWCADNIEGKEAEVLSNLVKTVTIKADAGAPAMNFLITQDYTKGRLEVLNSFLLKNYELPYVFINNLVDYFHKSTNKANYRQHYTADGHMPVHWFNTFKLFVSLNYQYLNKEQVEKLLATCAVNKHDKIVPAIEAYLRMRSDTIGKEKSL